MRTGTRDGGVDSLARVQQIRFLERVEDVPERVRQAFLQVPRHEFVDRYLDPYSADWTEVTRRNLSGHLSELYRDAPLTIWREGEGILSTISQPSFVLRILAELDIRSGDSVFELGTGSGWNTGLMAELAFPGQVVSAEIIVPLARQARERLRRLGFRNVTVIEGDGTDLPPGVDFDRAIFTAGAYDIPAAFHERIRPGGRFVFVLQSHAGADLLIVFDQTGTGFHSRRIIECGFVPVTGHPEWRQFEPSRLSALLEQMGFAGEGRRVEAPDLLLLSRLERAQEFLSLHDAYIPLFQHDGEFAWLSVNRRSLLVAKPWEWVEYGGPEASREAAAALNLWENWGRPARRDLRVRALPAGRARGEAGVIMHRPCTDFIWSL